MPSSRMPAISGIVLAAGASTRLGSPKQLLELDGKPILQHVIDACVGARLDEVVVVLGHDADRIRRSLQLPPMGKIVVNAHYGRGLSSSLVAGLAAVDRGSKAAVILLGDQPGMEAQHIERSLRAWRASDAQVVRALFGEVPGHPVVAAREAWPVLARASGDEGGRGLFNSGSMGVTSVQLGDEPLADVDTWEDYRRLTGSR